MKRCSGNMLYRLSVVSDFIVQALQIEQGLRRTIAYFRDL
jgi:hypothetical protein